MTTSLSNFVRNATPKEKEETYTKIIEGSILSQRAITKGTPSMKPQQTLVYSKKPGPQPHHSLRGHGDIEAFRGRIHEAMDEAGWEIPVQKNLLKGEHDD